MSYRVLARRYRPRTFAEVVGQEHVVRALSRALERQRVGQAYLLVGPRGVGKTSTARILAKSLNCESGPTVNPCLQCAPCLEIERGGDVDVMEIDGASNNGVDDVRALRERVHYRPLRDRRKIYIIDEVQRLSGPAFDALLKTLEEPPGHALFIFATTDPHKIPETITSRCQVFEFRRLREEDVLGKLRLVCRAEGVAVAEEVLRALARGCRGGLRDAESMLDQLLAVAEGEPSLDDLEMISGLARPERWLDLFAAIERGDGEAVVREVEEFLRRGGTERDFVEQAVDALRDLLHVALLGEDALGVEPAPERRERMRELARSFGRERLELLLGMAFSLDTRMRQAPLAARALLEWTLLRACRLGQWLDSGALLQALAGGGAAAAAAPGRVEPAARPLAPPPPSPPPRAVAGRAAGPAAAKPAAHPAAAGAVKAAPKRAPPPAGVEALLELAAKSQATLARILRENLVEGRVEAAEVQVVLRPLAPRDREVVEDSGSAAFLAALPGSPGPWRLSYRAETSAAADPMAATLHDLFGAREEVRDQEP